MCIFDFARLTSGFLRYASVSGVLLCGPFSQAMQSEEVPTSNHLPSELLQKLAAYDKVLVSGLTVDADFESSATTKLGKKVQFTASGEKCAVSEMRIPPQYRPREQGEKSGTPSTDASGGTDRSGAIVASDSDISYDANGVLRMLSTDDKVVHLFDEQKSARIQTTVEYFIAPDNKILKQNDKFNNVRYYPPDSITLVLPKLRVLWILGRGYSPYIKKITHVQEAENGMLRVTADGLSMMQGSGRWEFLIDPTLAYLVREASYFQAGATKPRTTVTNIGVKDRGLLPLPERGEFTITLGGSPVTYRLSLNRVSLAFDNELFSSVEQRFSADMPPNTNIHDNRTAPATYKFVNPKGKVARSNQTRKPLVAGLDNNRRFLLVLVNVMVVILLGLLLYAKRLRTRAID